MTLAWPNIMRLGLTRLRLTPAQFWALTPAELLLMLGHVPAQGAMTRHGLDALMQMYPDTVRKED